MAKLFLTGVTGYVGGSVFVRLYEQHPEYKLTVLLRKTPDDFTAKFPGVKIVNGAWETPAVLEDAASEVDIVVHCGDSDHLGAVTALLNGLVKQNRKVFYIHLSGTGTLSDYQDTDLFRGKLNPKTYSDIHDIDEITSRPMERLHRVTDSSIQAIGERYKDTVKTAIVAPPSIYGKGWGPGRTDSFYFPLFVPEVRKHGFTMYCNEGSNRKGWTHIEDLVDVYQLLIARAAAGGDGVTWGKNAYFLTTTQDASQKELATAVGKVLHEKNILPSPEPKQVDEDFISKTLTQFFVPNFGYYMLASNSRGVPERAKKELGWGGGRAPPLWEVLPGEVEAFFNRPDENFR
ncbi:nucleoside-diphosphate-sugar epimerase [Penicillium brasilianum]|uniref:Nucleoside-diphosphate-sugar epimerase n=1 Tax=Penicillium brasilianum TaxID=104259 RepID=A0A1S9RD10_PENBI|nr:nucleoside-diphosphate-sugar epimerase [Penicillium brasilianum]